ncbi:MAG: glycosyltransferase family 2 protein [Patescibacteria group bacterium]
MIKLSVAIATFNEEENIGRCLESVRKFADEIVVVDGSSTDKTVEIAKKFGAKVIVTNNPPIFHINKQKALDKCLGDWILQLDADEIVTPQLKEEIIRVIRMTEKEQDEYQQTLPKKHLFLRHQKLIEERDGIIGNQTGPYVAFFAPRLNFFLGKFLRYGGVYPDGVIRLVRKGKAHFPCQSVHEQIAVDGKVGWLQHELIHMADPTFRRYLERNNRYINLLVDDLRREHMPKNPVWLINYFLVKPIWWFFLTQVRHKGILDGYQGVIFSFFSALRFPRAYWRYLTKESLND